MRKSVILWILCISAAFFVSGCVVAVEGPPPGPAVAVEGPPPGPEPVAQVDVGAPPPLAVQEPNLVVVPSGDAYVYMMPNVAGVYFYDGFWYRYYGGGWFRSGIYNGPWVGIAVAPPVVVAIDPFWPFYLPAGYFSIGWWDFHHHWRDWGHRRHWHSHPHFRHEMRRDIRNSRLKQIRSDRIRGIDRSRSFQKSGSQFKSGQTYKGSTRTLKSGQTYKGTNRTMKSGQTYKGTQQFKGSQQIKSAPKSAPKSQSGGHSGGHDKR
jgi:hypothetical protein